MFYLCHNSRINVFPFIGFVLFSFLFIPSQGLAVSTDRISQYGIEWIFDGSYESGQYANGDFWVVGPVTITKISPDSEVARVSNSQTNTICTGNTAGNNACKAWCADNAPSGSTFQCMGPKRGAGICVCDNIRHGWEVNPMPLGLQGFDNRSGTPDASKVPSLPYTALPGDSLIKAMSRNPTSLNCNADDKNNITCLQTASVLTVVADIPENRGANLFRPPYVGTEKPSYTTTQLRLDLLPQYPPVADTPPLDWVYTRYRKVQLDHLGGNTGRATHPIDHMPDYGGEIGVHNGDGALRLMLNDPISSKLPGLIAYVQYGIDLYHMVLNGHNWPGGGGYRPGQRGPLSFAATMLDDPTMKSTVNGVNFLDEDTGVFRGNDGKAIFGFENAMNEDSYWGVVVDYNAGNRTLPDPYRQIDGGHFPGSGYQYCCISQPFKGQVLARELMPAMKAAWSDPEIGEYVDRWVEHGAWSQPDVCAPADGQCVGGPNPGAACNTATGDTPCGSGGTCNLLAYSKDSANSHYGVTYGPDGKGGCIRDTNPADGIGRFPQRHGQYKDEGLHSSRFQKSMWNAYRYKVMLPAPPTFYKYVDVDAKGKNDGSSWDNAWISFSAIDWSKVNPGDTIWVSGGNYEGNINLTKSGTSSAPILIKASQQQGHNDRITILGGVSLNASWVALDGAKSDTFSSTIKGVQDVPLIKENINIFVNAAANNNHGFNMGGGDLEGFKVKWVEVTTSTDDRVGFRFNPTTGFDHVEISYSWIHDVGSDAVYVTQNNRSHFDVLTVHHCLIERTGDDGLEVASGNTVHHNIIRDTRFIRGHPDGMQTTGSYQRIYNNIFEDWANSHLRIQGFEEVYTGIEIYGNLFVNDWKYDDGSPITWPVITATAIELAWYGNQQPWNTRDFSYWRNFMIVNNTFADLAPKQAISFAKRSWLGEARIENLHIQNNVIFNCGERSGTALGVPGNSPAMGGWLTPQDQAVVDDNIIARTSTQAAVQIGFLGLGDVVNSLGTLFSKAEKMADLTLYKNNVSSTPVFSNATAFNFHLLPTDGIARNNGAALSPLSLPGLQVDLEGHVRGRDGLWDRGAFEYESSTPSIPVAPRIQVQPGNRTVQVGQSAVFSISAAGSSALTYRWFKNGQVIAGATSVSYTTPATVIGDNGAKFYCEVKNSIGVVTSSTATLTVSPPTAPVPPIDPPSDNPNNPPNNNSTAPSGTRFYAFKNVMRNNEPLEIKYHLDESGPVTFELRNRHGEVLKTFDEGEKTVGDGVLIWDGRNNKGDKVASGVYQLELNVNGKKIQTKVVVAK